MAFKEKYPQLARQKSPAELYQNPNIQLIISAAIPKDRTKIAIEARQHGKDMCLNKPAILTLEDYRAVEKTVQQTGRIFSVFFAEQVNNRCTLKALQLVEQGLIGRVIHLMGIGRTSLVLPTIRDRKHFGRFSPPPNSPIYCIY